MKARGNEFDHIWHLVTRTFFNPGKVDIVSIIDLNHMVYVLQSDSTHSRFHGTVKAEN